MGPRSACETSARILPTSWVRIAGPARGETCKNLRSSEGASSLRGRGGGLRTGAHGGDHGPARRAGASGVRRPLSGALGRPRYGPTRTLKPQVGPIRGGLLSGWAPSWTGVGWAVSRPDGARPPGQGPWAGRTAGASGRGWRRAELGVCLSKALVTSHEQDYTRSLKRLGVHSPAKKNKTTINENRGVRSESPTLRRLWCIRPQAEAAETEVQHWL